MFHCIVLFALRFVVVVVVVVVVAAVVVVAVVVVVVVGGLCVVVVSWVVFVVGVQGSCRFADRHAGEAGRSAAELLSDLHPVSERVKERASE
jgi:hypothetical protein